jgi:dTDP-4-amino-4,6-dideoxygalactose transaminase
VYNELLAGTDLVTPVEPSGSEHVYHLYVVRSQNRDALQTYLKERGIGTGIHYPDPVHLQPFYSNGMDRHGQFPVAEQICQEILSLPMFPDMTDEQVETVSSEIANLLVPTG